MPSLRRGDVVLIPFPFTDLTSSKVRSALVISADDLSEDIVVAFVSSVVRDKLDPFDVLLPTGEPGFKETGLKRSSVFRMSKIATLHRSLAIRRLGRTTEALQEQLDKRLASALELVK